MPDGEAFMQTTSDAETTDAASPEKFDVRKWRKGAALVTRSVEVYGRPDLLGQIEALDAEIVRAQSSEFDDHRPLAKSLALELAEERTALAAQMSESVQVFRFRGLRSGELEALRAEHGPDDAEGITDLDYKVWAAQCVQPRGLTWEDFKALHVGDDESDGLGAYFMQTIARTANLAASANGVDVPFSSASSSLIASSGKN